MMNILNYLRTLLARLIVRYLSGPRSLLVAAWGCLAAANVGKSIMKELKVFCESHCQNWSEACPLLLFLVCSAFCMST
jgi:hypothetical protein